MSFLSQFQILLAGFLFFLVVFGAVVPSALESVSYIKAANTDLSERARLDYNSF